MYTALRFSFKVILVILLQNISVASYAQAGDDELSIQSLSALGKSYFNNGNYAEAIKHYSAIIKRLPNNQTALTYRGNSYFNLEKYDLALIDYNKVLLINPDPYLFFYRASIYDTKKDYGSAIKDYTSAIGLKPDYADAYFNRGIAYFNKSAYTEALADFSMTIVLNPKNHLAYYNRGIAQQQLKQYSASIQDFSTTLKIEPQYTNALHKRALAYYNNKEFHKSIADYDAILKVESNNFVAVHNKGLAYKKLGEKDKAITEFTKAININPSYHSSYDQRGDTYLELNKNEKALADFNEAIKLNPSSDYYYTQRGRAYYAMQSYTNAIEDYTRYIKTNPTVGQGYYLRGMSYAAAKNTTQALNDYNQAIKFDANLDYAYLNRGGLFYSQGEHAKAMADYEKALEINPKNVYAHWYMGIAHFYSGNAEKAIKKCTDALAIEPRNNIILTSRAGAYVYLAKYKEAIADYEQSLSIDPLYASTYIDYFTALLHTGDIVKAKSLYQVYKSKNLKRDNSNDDWKFYEHYVNALTEGVFQNSYEKALSELNLAEQKFETISTTDHQKNQAKFGYVDILFLKGYVNEQLGKLDKAAIAYEQALIINNNQHDVKDALERLNKKSAIAIKTDKTPPTITLISPKATRSIDIVSDTDEKQILGRAHDASGIKSVIINGKPVSEFEVQDQTGYFTQNLILNEGQNVIKIEATDNNGNTATQLFTISASKNDNVRSEPKPQASVNKEVNIKGQYHAIIIGEEDYSNGLTKLSHPVKDARKLKSALETYYTFDSRNISLLENKSRDEIMTEIIRKCNTLDTADNLLIFYAGHGKNIPNRMGLPVGYWIPTSAKKDSIQDYIKDTYIQDQLYNSRAKHILVIADACDAGAWNTRSVIDEAPKEIQLQYENRSRKFMTSGNLHEVDDVSTFMAHLVDRLINTKKKYFSAHDLYYSIRDIVLKSGTQPIYKPVPATDDFGGDFIFVRKN